MPTEDWRKQWPEVATRLANCCPQYTESAKRRRLLKQATPWHAVERLCKQLLKVVHPERLWDVPTPQTCQRLCQHRFLFGQGQKIRRVFRDFPQVPVHAEIVKAVCAQRVCNEEEKQILRGMRNQPRRTETFLLCVDAWRKLNNLDSFGSLFKVAPEMQTAAVFCMRSRLRFDMLRSLGVTSKSLRKQIKLTQKQFQLAKTQRANLTRKQFLCTKARTRSKMHKSAESFCALSAWHASLMTQFVDFTVRTQKTSFAAKNIERCKRLFARIMTSVQRAVQPRCLQAFLENATATDVQKVLIECASKIQIRHLHVRSQIQRHHASQFLSSALRVMKSLRCMSHCDFAQLKVTDMLRTIENKNASKTCVARRTFSDQEVQSMFAVARDPAEVVLLRLLHEIALRNSALCHLQYCMLLDETHRVLDVCRVPEKGGKARYFVVSEQLRADIQHLSSFLRAHYPNANLSTCYPLNLANIWKPIRSLGDMFARIARDAGVQGEHVHPHAFRHTLVGTLMARGNSLETVSKFMGHNDSKTTSTFYWVPSATELNMQLQPAASEVRYKQIIAELLTMCDADKVKQKLPFLTAKQPVTPRESQIEKFY